MPQSTTPRKPFNMVLSETEYGKLQDLAGATGMSGAAVMRAALVTYHAMKINRVPLCATGQPCFVPQMHTATAPIPAPHPLKGAVNG